MSRGQLQSGIRSVLLGVLIGLPVLGVGGRLVMRIIAVATGAPSSFTMEGTLTVLLSGAGSGAIAGAIYGALFAALPRRRVPRDIMFLLILSALTARGLRPIQPLALALFAPLMAIFAAVFLASWRRFAIGAPRAEAAA